MLATEPSDVKGKVQREVCNGLLKYFRGSTMTDIYPKVISPTRTQCINPNQINNLREGWQTLIDNLGEQTFNVLPRASMILPPFEPCYLYDLAEDVVKFCSENNILYECNIYLKLFAETFKNIKKITISVSNDYELLNYQKIRFLLTISDEIEGVLKYEEIFRSRIAQEINRDKRHYFIYNYNLI